MAVKLQKGQKIDLTKGGTGLANVMVGLGWDEAAPAQSSGGGFFGLFKAPAQQSIDCDASAILLDANGKLISRNANECCVYFGNLRHRSNAIVHQGDNLTGAGDGDDEQIMVNLSAVPAEIHKIVFVVNIYDANKKGQHFGMIQNAFIRLVDMRNQQEICRFNLSENYNGMTGLIAAEIYRYNGEWKFNAIGQSVQEASHLQSLLNLYV